jgi:hypothetical protein
MPGLIPGFEYDNFISCCRKIKDKRNKKQETRKEVLDCTTACIALRSFSKGGTARLARPKDI